MAAQHTEPHSEHGLSVGPRYDPDSIFFNRQCICDEDWAGDLCNIPINDQCNGRGQYIKTTFTPGRCKCHGYYFGELNFPWLEPPVQIGIVGPNCQYVGKCVNGKLQEGKCVCSYGYEGDYCGMCIE